MGGGESVGGEGVGGDSELGVRAFHCEIRFPGWWEMGSWSVLGVSCVPS